MERDVVAGTLRLDARWRKVKPGSSKPYERFVMAIFINSTDDWSFEQLLEESDGTLRISDNNRDVAQLVEDGWHVAKPLWK
jgi:hypothetical protein